LGLVSVAFAVCTGLYAETSNPNIEGYFSCSNKNDLAFNVSGAVPSFVSSNPVVFYRFANNNCGGTTPSSINIFLNDTCFSIPGSTQVSAYCSQNNQYIYKYSGEDTDSSCFLASKTNTYQNAVCYVASTISFVYLCPGDLTASCTANDVNDYRNQYTLECTPQSIFTDPPVTLTAATHPFEDVSEYKTCDIYYPDQVRSGWFANTTAYGSVCCKSRGIVQEGVCVNYNCGGGNSYDYFIYNSATSSADGQYCFNDCNGFGEVNVNAEYIVHYTGAIWTGNPEPYNPTTTVPVNVSSVYITMNVTNAHEVGYYVQPAFSSPATADAYGNTDYGCRFRGVYSSAGSTCTVTGACNGATVTVYTTSFLYNGNICFAECHTQGVQFSYPLAAAIRKRSEVQENLAALDMSLLI